MGKLKDYYRLFDMFNGKLNDEQKKLLEGLEDELIAEEILPAISESVAPVLSILRRHLTLVVDYDPEGGITVKTTRGKVEVKEHTAKKYEIPASKKMVKVAEAETKEKQPIKRSPKTGLCVWISSDEFIQEKNAAWTMTKAIEAAGVEKVASLNMPHDGEKLVSKLKHPKYTAEQKQLSNGYLLNTHSSTKTKKAQIEDICSKLGLSWKIDIIK